VGYVYDAASRLETVTDWDSLVTIYVYDKAGRLGTVTLPNGIVSTYEYDDASRLLSLTHEDDPITFASYGYTYDDVGNRLTADEAVRQPDESTASMAITYEYDPLYRLTEADYDDETYYHYTYDAVGNRLTEATESGTTTYQYDIANRLADVDSVEFTWDDNGNLLDDGTSEYAYDHANRLASVTQGGDLYTFTYNGLGDRLRQIINSSPTNYTLDLAAGLTQVLADGANAYLYGVARIGEEQPGGRGYHLPDGLGSLRQLVDVDTQVGLTRSYQPFGTPIASYGTSQTLFGFTGEQRDGTGLVYLRARYLSSSTGRFVQSDPSDEESNLFIYAMANPVNRTDPTGMFSENQIARSFGLSSFDMLIEVLKGTKPPPLLPNDDKWGFLAAMLEAEEGDSIAAGSLILTTITPHVQYTGGNHLWLLNCNEIMVGGRRLVDYFDYVLLQPTWRDLPAEYWRDTSPSYHRLSGRNGTKTFADGTTRIDIPDYHSVDAMFWMGGAAISGIVDRFGNQYISVGVAGDGGGLFYSEGYVCGGAQDCPGTVPSTEAAVRGTIEGPCVIVEVAVVGGVAYTVCFAPDGLRSALVYTWGYGATVGSGVSRAIWVGRAEARSWNWAIRDRVSGVMVTDITH